MDDDKPDFSKKLFCIEYPGQVNNVNNMLNTLGGVDGIGTVCKVVRNNKVFIKNPICRRTVQKIGE